MGVSYTSRATTLRRFDLRDGNLGLMGKELRLIPFAGRSVADLERFPGRCLTCSGVGHLVQLWVGKNFRDVRHLVQLRPPYQWVDSTQRDLDLEVGIPSR